MVQVDYNRELVTVGLSNVVTGLFGAGFTGSYIFSQTIFTQRSGCQNRLNGYVIVVAEALLFIIPRSFVEFLPNFYYGALMLVFGLEIAADWLVFSSSKFTRAEFILTWVNFVAIMIAVARLPVSGLEVGIGIGVLICAVHFALEYSSVQLKTFTLVSSRSNCVRPMTQRKVLELFQANSCAPRPWPAAPRMLPVRRMCACIMRVCIACVRRLRTCARGVQVYACRCAGLHAARTYPPQGGMCAADVPRWPVCFEPLLLHDQDSMRGRYAPAASLA